MNYTSIKQSKKLLELGLSAKTADMCYILISIDDYGTGTYKPALLEESFKENLTSIPCWSVGALLEVMPNHTEITKIDGLWAISANDFLDTISDSIIDALVDKIQLLLENNYIKKG